MPHPIKTNFYSPNKRMRINQTLIQFKCSNDVQKHELEVKNVCIVCMSTVRMGATPIFCAPTNQTVGMILSENKIRTMILALYTECAKMEH